MHFNQKKISTLLQNLWQVVSYFNILKKKHNLMKKKQSFMQYVYVFLLDFYMRNK